MLDLRLYAGALVLVLICSTAFARAMQDNHNVDGSLFGGLARLTTNFVTELWRVIASLLTRFTRVAVESVCAFALGIIVISITRAIASDLTSYLRQANADYAVAFTTMVGLIIVGVAATLMLKLLLSSRVGWKELFAIAITTTGYIALSVVVVAMIFVFLSHVPALEVTGFDRPGVITISLSIGLLFVAAINRLVEHFNRKNAG